VSKGFLIYAQNSGKTDYIEQAYALALSIKHSQSDIKNVSLVTNSKVSDEYKSIFDNIIAVPWSKETSGLHAEHRWQVYYATPYDETIVLDSDMLFFEDIATWWDYCGNYDIKFCSRIKNYKLEHVIDAFHRKTFVSNNLTSPYYALHYFKKNQSAFEFYKVLEFVCNNWEYCWNLFAPIDKQNSVSMDLAAAIAIEICGIQDSAVDSKNPLEFIHMKTPLQGWEIFPQSWKDTVPYTLNNRGELFVGNIRQTKLFHYVEKDFITSSILNKLKALCNG